MSRSPEFLSAADIHARVDWPAVLQALGIDGALLEIRRGKRSKNAPCPNCGGEDRFFFDNRHGRGDFFCGKCGPGDGFELLERVHKWTFKEARARVIEAAGLADTDAPRQVIPDRPAPRAAPAAPTDRIHRLRRGRCSIEHCADAVDYLASRALWPLPAGCALKAHATVEYFDPQGRPVGHFPALIADVVDIAGELVTVHVTYLERGQKLSAHEPRKLLSPLTDREGCAVRLAPAGDVLGIAEGLETALSAAAIDSVPVWAALSAPLLAKFEPPPGVIGLRVYADRDEAGLTAAIKLIERLQGRIGVQVRIPTAPAKDWNDALTARGR